jgi:hypothetical protein
VSDIPGPMTDGSPAACILVSASCTTSWLDWIHGELWLCPNGILRRSLGLATTFRHMNRQTVDPMNRPVQAFDPVEIRQIAAGGRRNRWITWSEVAHMTLKRGIIDHSLHVELDTGHRDKFLWLRIDVGYDLLEEALGRALPGRFTALDKAIG